MTKFLLAALAASIAAPSFAQANHYVQGYVRKDGTYVAPHYQTNPDTSRLNNYSTMGNVNPYTGQAGTVNPYRQPPAPTYNPYGAVRRPSGGF